MIIKNKMKQMQIFSLSRYINTLNDKFHFRKGNILTVVVLLLVLTANVFSGLAMPVQVKSPSGPIVRQAVATLNFASQADAYVDELHASVNYGTADFLQVEKASGRNNESYIRFSVSGVSGTIQSAILRVYTTTNSSTNGPGVYKTSSTWTETGVNWNNRPAPTSSVIDNKGAISKNSWTDYNVTSQVTGNGTYSFALIGDSTDEIRFSSREGSNPPQLVITFNSSTNTPTATALTRTPTRTPTQLSSTLTFTRTPTRTPTQSLSTLTVTRTPTRTSTPAAGSSFTFTPTADAYVASDNATTNYGSLTTLRADGSPDVRSYLRFSVQGVSGTITRATLRVFANSAAGSGYDARAVSNNTWSESTITYGNAPSVGSVLGSSGSISAGTWTSIDVTAYVTSNNTYNFGITTTGSTAISFASRESGSNAPQLIVQTSGGATAAPTATRTSTPSSTGTAFPTATRTPTLANTSTAIPTASRTLTPSATSSGSVVFVGAGDISTCGNNNDEATAKLLDGISGTVFTAGDNAYESGTYTEYINCYDPTWGRHKARTKPVPGNHEYNTSGAAGYFQYFNNVSAYYAYNLGAWRIYALNSEIDVSAGGSQATWLQSDLAANPHQCVLAYWHKARWSSGTTHGSTSSMQTIWQILYNAGAELVIAGHEHNYERFAEMNASGSAMSPGLREIVVGTGGNGHYSFGTALSASQVRNSSTFGVLKLTLRSNGYDWQFVPVAGSTFTDSGSTNCH